MTTRAIIFYSTLLFSGHLFAQAKSDTIVMKNGDRLTGEIKALGGGVLSVDLPYVDGTLSVQWSQVAKLESDRLFLVHTEGGAVYTGKISATGGASKDLPIEIRLVDEAAKEVPGKEAESKEVEVAQGKIIKLNQTALGFWKRFDGAINTGSLYSKGNESVQFNLGSQVRYTRERWQAGFNLSSSLASNSGASVSTRNQIDLNFERLMRWNNWFYTGSASFLQSQVQEIDLQTTISGGVGRYLKNTNRQTISLFGGIGWQNARYGAKCRQSGIAKHSSRLRREPDQDLQIQENQPGFHRLPDTRNHRARTNPLQHQCGLLPQDHRRSLVEHFILRKLGHSPARKSPKERLRHQLRTQLDLR